MLLIKLLAMVFPKLIQDTPSTITTLNITDQDIYIVRVGYRYISLCETPSFTVDTLLAGTNSRLPDTRKSALYSNALRSLGCWLRLQ